MRVLSQSEGKELFSEQSPMAAEARPPRRMKMGLRMGMDRDRNGGETANINLIRPTWTHL